MISIKNITVNGWEAAIRGMRNPLNSWDKSDSYEGVDCGKCGMIEREGSCEKSKRNCSGFETFYIGPNDLDLMKRLYKAGPEHAKYLRMINVTMDITAPLYWWKEYDTYKVGTVTNSCSTMHKLTDKEFVLDDFSHEHLVDIDNGEEDQSDYNPFFSELCIVICMLNRAREQYLKTKNKPMKDEEARQKLMKKYWWQMVQLLPTSYNQKRTVQLNYANIMNIINQRENHKLDEWRVLCKILRALPYVEALRS